MVLVGCARELRVMHGVMLASRADALSCETELGWHGTEQCMLRGLPH